MRATHTGPLLRRRSRSLIWTGRPEGSSTPWRREGDFLLTPNGPLVLYGRRTRALARREVDGVYRWVGRGELALDVDGIRSQHADDTRLLRSCFDSGTTGWTTSVPAGASIAAETTAGAFMFADDVTTQNLVLTQASPAATDNYFYQQFTPPSLWQGISTIRGAIAVGHYDPGGSPLSVALQRMDDSLYWDFAGGWGAGITYAPLTVRATAPAIDFVVGDFTTPIGGGRNFRVRVAQPAGVATGAVNRCYYANVHSYRPFVTSPVRNLGTLGEQRAQDYIRIPNYVGARSFPADHGTLSIWVRPAWDLTDVLSAVGSHTLGLTDTFGICGCVHDSNDRMSLSIDQGAATLRLLTQASGAYAWTDMPLAAFNRDQWYHVAARWIGVAGELGYAPLTMCAFLDGVKGPDGTSAAPLTESDYATVPLGIFDGTLRHFEIYPDCLTDAEIAAIYAAGPGA